MQKKHTIKLEAINYKTLTKYKEKREPGHLNKDIQHTKKNTVLHVILHGKLWKCFFCDPEWSGMPAVTTLTQNYTEGHREIKQGIEVEGIQIWI